MQIPEIGGLKPKVTVPLAIGIAGFVGWRWWQARKAVGTGDESTISDGEFGAIDTSIPDTLNPFPGSFGGGGGGGGDSSTGDRNGDGTIGPGEFTNNGQWTDYVVDRLQGDRWTSNDVQLALGLGLAGKPTTDAQQEILRAAIAVGGQPPSGSLTVVSGGNTSITVAPGGVSVSPAETTATVSFSSVPGANSYQVFRNGIASPAGAGSSSPIVIGGLTPNTSYGVSVAAVTTSGTPGPKSSEVGFKTKAFTMAAPGRPSITGITTNGAVATISPVANADEYIWYLNGNLHATTEGVRLPLTGLKPGTGYRVKVTARGFHQLAGPASADATFTTKK
jgi:hypothetical protein